MAAGVVADAYPCRGPTWLERAENNDFLKKMSELSENLRFDSEFVLLFEIWPFKVANPRQNKFTDDNVIKNGFVFQNKPY